MQRLLSQITRANGTSSTATAENTTGDGNEIDDFQNKFKSWSYRGKIRINPEGFTFPSLPVKPMWNLWWFGDEVTGIRPFRSLVGHRDDLLGKANKDNLSRAKKVMDAIEVIILKNNPVKRVRLYCRAESDAVFQMLLKS